jgi:hypothetical protein
LAFSGIKLWRRWFLRQFFDSALVLGRIGSVSVHKTAEEHPTKKVGMKCIAQARRHDRKRTETWAVRNRLIPYRPVIGGVILQRVLQVNSIRQAAVVSHHRECDSDETGCFCHFGSRLLVQRPRVTLRQQPFEVLLKSWPVFPQVMQQTSRIGCRRKVIVAGASFLGAAASEVGNARQVFVEELPVSKVIEFA